MMLGQVYSMVLYKKKTLTISEKNKICHHLHLQRNIDTKTEILIKSKHSRVIEQVVYKRSQFMAPKIINLK